MVTYGDGVSDVDLGDCSRSTSQHGTLATVTGVRPSSRFGELLVERRSGRRSSARSRRRTRAGSTAASSSSSARRSTTSSDDDDCVLEREPLERLAADGQLSVYQHDGFWQCMDTYRDYQHLERAVGRRARPPWKVWW